LFSFAKSRSYLPKNGITEADALNKSKVGDTDTMIFEPAVMRKLLFAAPPKVIPFLAISAFAGLRAAEIARLDWGAINLDRRIIEIRAGQAKTASRRIVPISKTLRAWLQPLVRTDQ
jgi:integrase